MSLLGTNAYLLMPNCIDYESVLGYNLKNQYVNMLIIRILH